MKKVVQTALELRLVNRDENGEEVSHYCCSRSVSFKKFDKKKAEKFVSTVQSIAQTIGEILGFSVY